MTSQTHGVLHSESKSRCIFDGNIVASKCSIGILGISVEEFNLTWKFKQIWVYIEGLYYGCLKVPPKETDLLRAVSISKDKHSSLVGRNDFKY